MMGLAASLAALIAIAVVLGPMPESAEADKGQPQVTSRDSGKDIVTVVEDGGGGVKSRSGRNPADRSSGNSTDPGDHGPITVNDPQCVATNSIDVRCVGSGASDPDAGAATDVFNLAVRAMNQLQLPNPEPQLVPRISFSDGKTGGIVGAPAWLWIHASNWVTFVQRTEAGANWASVTARPVSQHWEFGDGGKVTCYGPGVAYRNSQSAVVDSPSCGYRYLRTSKQIPGGAFLVQVSVTWQVTWIGAGQASGSLGPIQLTTTFPYVVREARAQLVAP